MKIEINIDESAVDRLMTFLESRFPAVERAKTKAEKREEATKIRVEGRYKRIFNAIAEANKHKIIDESRAVTLRDIYKYCAMKPGTAKWDIEHLLNEGRVIQHTELTGQKTVRYSVA